MFNLLPKLVEIICLCIAAALAFSGLWLQACYFLVAATYIAVQISSKITQFTFKIPLSKELDDELAKLLKETPPNKGEKE